MNLTLEALKKILSESNLVTGLEDKLADIRKTLHEEKEKAAVEKMQADIKSKEASEPEQDQAAAPTV